MSRKKRSRGLTNGGGVGVRHEVNTNIPPQTTLAFDSKANPQPMTSRSMPMAPTIQGVATRCGDRVSIHQAAHDTGVDPKDLMREILSGKLTADSDGMIPAEDLDRWMDLVTTPQGEQAPAAPIVEPSVVQTPAVIGDAPVPLVLHFIQNGKFLNAPPPGVETITMPIDSIVSVSRVCELLAVKNNVVQGWFKRKDNLKMRSGRETMVPLIRAAMFYVSTGSKYPKVMGVAKRGKDLIFFRRPEVDDTSLDPSPISQRNVKSKTTKHLAYRNASQFLDGAFAVLSLSTSPMGAPEIWDEMVSRGLSAGIVSFCNDFPSNLGWKIRYDMRKNPQTRFARSEPNSSKFTLSELGRRMAEGLGSTGTVEQPVVQPPTSVIDRFMAPVERDRVVTPDRTVVETVAACPTPAPEDEDLIALIMESQSQIMASQQRILELVSRRKPVV